MSETNGQGKSRLDRIEELIEKQVLANEAAHERFEAEDKRLLTAQILMNDAMVKMAGAMEETTGKLNALIDTVDGIIRGREGKN
jgi:hypothetical protein